MKKYVFFLISIFILTNTAGVWAADELGRFAVRNAGMVTCQSFVDEKVKKSAKFNLYMGWIDGYISAANQFTKDTYDLIPWGNTVFLAALLENHCKKNPEQRFYIAVNKLTGAMLQQRLKTQSKLIETSHKGKKSYIYRSTLQKVQEHLQNRDLYKGKVDGNFNTETRKSLESYQKSQNIAITGLPDQITLYKIFREIAAEEE